MTLDLWARFDVKHKGKFPKHIGDWFHLCKGFPFKEQVWNDIPIVCLTSTGVPDQFVREISNQVEHRKKCPVCYQYWMKRRLERQGVTLKIDADIFRREYQCDIHPLEDEEPEQR